MKRRALVLALVVASVALLGLAFASPRPPARRATTCTVTPRLSAQGRIDVAGVEAVTSAADCLVHTVADRGALVPAGGTVASIECLGERLSPIFETQGSLIRVALGEDIDRVVAERALVVADAPVLRGGGVREGMPLVTVADASAPRVVVELEAADATRVAPGAAARITSLDGAPLATGTLVRLSARMEPHTFAASEPPALLREGVVTLDGAPRLPLGLTVDVALALAPVRGSCVPRSAVGLRDGRTFVRIVSTPFDATRAVDVRAVDETRAVVTGLRAGTLVREEAP